MNYSFTNLQLLFCSVIFPSIVKIIKKLRLSLIFIINFFHCNAAKKQPGLPVIARWKAFFDFAEFRILTRYDSDKGFKMFEMFQFAPLRYNLFHFKTSLKARKYFPQLSEVSSWNMEFAHADLCFLNVHGNAIIFYKLLIPLAAMQISRDFLNRYAQL